MFVSELTARLFFAFVCICGLLKRKSTEVQITYFLVPQWLACLMSFPLVIHSQPGSSVAPNFELEYHLLKHFPFICYLLTVARNGPVQASAQICPKDVHCVRGGLDLICVHPREA